MSASLRVAAAGVVVAAVLTLPAPPASAAERKVTICHATSSPTNPYRVITVSLAAAREHLGHRGPVFDPDDITRRWGDIIPDRDSGGVGEGLNWSAEGRRAFSRGTCNGADIDDTASDPTFDPSPDDPADVDDPSARDDLVIVCHATDDPDRPYEAIIVTGAELLDNNSHLDHEGPLPDPALPDEPWGDIVPDENAGGVADGLNWTAEGREIHSGGRCDGADAENEPADPLTDPGEDIGDPEIPDAEGVIWIDDDGDGIPDPDEARLPDVPVVITDVDDPSDSRSTVTDDDGEYRFVDVDPGRYEIDPDLPPELERTTGDTVFDVEPGATPEPQALGSSGTATIEGTVTDAGQSVDGALVTCVWSGDDDVTGTDDDADLSATTASDGTFGVDDVPAGRWACMASDPRTGRSSTVRETLVPADGVGTVPMALTRSATLPATGSPSRTVTTAALTALALGAVLVVGSRRRASLPPV